MVRDPKRGGEASTDIVAWLNANQRFLNGEKPPRRGRKTRRKPPAGEPLTFAEAVEVPPARGRSPVLPTILAGPIVRRATPDEVWFWFAFSHAVLRCDAKLATGGTRLQASVRDFRSARLGQKLWVALVCVAPSSGSLPTDTIIGYDLRFIIDSTGTTTAWLSQLLPSLAYPPFETPTFVVGRENRVIAHGSCRRPGGAGVDASGALDESIERTCNSPLARPASLILTGDQIYADDVTLPLFRGIQRLASDLFGYAESLPHPQLPRLISTDDISPGKSFTTPLAFSRGYLTRIETSPIGFTTSDGERHLLSFAEFAAMYLLVWNPELLKEFVTPDSMNLVIFQSSTLRLRRALANVATYMLFDDHEITDDWNLDQAWEDKTKANPTARRVISNGLAAYWAFQAWGNDPRQFGSGGGMRLVAIVERHLQELRLGKGTPRAGAKEYEDVLLARQWSFVAASNPKALCLDTRTRRETPSGEAAILSGPRLWRELRAVLAEPGIVRGQLLLVVLPTPLLPHRMMVTAQAQKFSFPKQRYEADRELYANNPAQRAALMLWLHDTFNPSAVVIFSGDVHFGGVVSGRYGFGMNAASIRSGTSAWAMRVVQVTSSPIKNVNSDIASYGSIGESLVTTTETQYASIRGGTLLMQAAARKLRGPLSSRTYVEDNHYCVVQLPAAAGGNVEVSFVGASTKAHKLPTASVTVDTDNSPSRFRVAGPFSNQPYYETPGDAEHAYAEGEYADSEAIDTEAEPA